MPPSAPWLVTLQMLPRTKGAAWQLGHLAGLAEALTSRMEAGKAPLQPAEQVLAQLAELTSQAADILGVPHEQVCGFITCGGSGTLRSVAHTDVRQCCALHLCYAPQGNIPQ